MTTGEDESELVVTHGPVLSPIVGVDSLLCSCDRIKLLMKLSTPSCAAKIIDCTISCGRDDPTRRVGWNSVPPPTLARHNERVLDGVFGECDVTEDADQRRHRLAVHLPEHALNVGRFPMGGDAAGQVLKRPASRRMG